MTTCGETVVRTGSPQPRTSVRHRAMEIGLTPEAGGRSPRLNRAMEIGLTPEAGGRSPRLNRAMEIGLTPEAGGRSPRLNRAMEILTPAAEVAPFDRAMESADARGWRAFAPFEPCHGNRADARGRRAFAPFEPRTHVRGHVTRRTRRDALKGAVMVVMATGRETVVRTGSPPTSHMSAIDRRVLAGVRGSR